MHNVSVLARRLVATLTAALSLVLALACSESVASRSATEWSVEPTPVLAIGVREGSPEFELGGVSSAVMRADGQVAVANSGTSEIRFYSSTGEFVRAVGRSGMGPGEFSGAPLYLDQTAPDTLLVFDTGNWRATRLDTAGSVSGTSDLSGAGTLPFTWRPTVYPRAFVRVDEEPSVRACTDVVLPRVAAARASVPAVLAHVDQLGYLWTTPLPADSTSSTPWHIYDTQGQEVATASTPLAFMPYAIGADRILGRQEDSEGVEQVMILRLDRKGAERSVCPPTASALESPLDSVVISGLQAGLRAAIRAQEAHYAERMTYGMRVDDLRLEDFPDARLVILAADKRHWFGLVVDNRTGATCAGGVGYQPPGWREAEPTCR